jgi:hypothetical protein
MNGRDPFANSKRLALREFRSRDGRYSYRNAINGSTRVARRAGR